MNELQRPRLQTPVVPRLISTLENQQIQIPDATGLTHLQFRRFAGCPICNLHLQSFVRRHEELRAARIREVVVFHSSADELRRYEASLPFPVVADPDKLLYVEFGVAPSVWSLLSPRVWWPLLRAVFHGLIACLWQGAPLPPLRPPGGSFGLPGDFLIAPDGRIVAANYGEHADDQWSVDELLALARAARRSGY